MSADESTTSHNQLDASQDQGAAESSAAEVSAPVPPVSGTTATELETTAETQTEPAADAVPSTEFDYIEALKQVIDPELMVNIVDLGLVYSVAQDEENDRKVAVEMTLTSPACPAGPQIVQQAKMALERLHDVDEARITLTMSPPWSPDRMTDDAKDQLGIF